MLELLNLKSDYEIYAANLHGNINYTSVYTPKDYDDAVGTCDKTLWLQSMEEENKSIVNSR